MADRKEKDSMGEMNVPESALYGASTQRAVLNFPISNLRFPRSFIAAMGLIKLAASEANADLGLLPEDKAKAIQAACQEVIEGVLDNHFVLDIFQTGSGTSTNMNANEVIANRAAQIMGGKLGDKDLVHPNDHVNMSQSSNDTIPTAMHISAYQVARDRLVPALDYLAQALEAKAKSFSSIVKAGRTHLMDATPVTLGQEFGGYAAQIRLGIERINSALTRVRELALGGTAVGTGINTHPEFPAKTIDLINKRIRGDLIEARNHFEAQGAQDSIVELSGQLRTVACSLMKIANDIRWMGSGPRCGLFELKLPEIQPGSSIMPAKVNPVVCESVMMVAAQIIGNDACIAVAGQHGNFELIVMLPVMAHNILESLELLASVSRNFVDKCIAGLEANEERCNLNAEKSLATCTSLAPKIGYDKAAALAKQALAEDKTVKELALSQKVLPEAELNRVLDLMSMTKPGL